MHEFSFHRPQSVAAAVNALRDSDDAKILGGGQSLIPILKLGLASYDDVVSLASVDGLAGIRADKGAVVVGAMTTHADVAGSSAVRGAIPALAALAGGIGDPQVRNRGTLGGSLAHNDPAADYPAAVVGLNATVHTDRRQIAAGDFFTGMFDTALEEDEVITAVSFPVPEAAAYAKFPNPASKFAIVGVFVARTQGGVRVAVTGAGGCVFRQQAFEAALAGRFAADAIDGIAVSTAGLTRDVHAGPEYRAHLISVMTRRAVGAC